MVILHVAYLDYTRCDGILTVLSHLIPYQRLLGHRVYVANINKEASEERTDERTIITKSDFHNYIENSHPDVVVFNTMYKWPIYAFAKYLKKRSIPYISIPHGASTSIAQRKGWFKKTVCNFFFTRNFVRGAVGILHFSEKEQEECVFSVCNKQRAILPNGTELPLNISISRLQRAEVSYIYLSRIDVVEKGLNILIPAWLEWHRSTSAKAMLHIYGDIQTETDKILFDDLMKENDGSIIYHGKVFGKEKDKVLRNSDIHILPSRHEGMPMSVLESLAYGLPNIVTHQTNMGELVAGNKAGWVAQLNSVSLQETINLSYKEYIASTERLRQNAINAVKEYSWENIAMRSIKIYNQFVKSFQDATN